MKIIKELKHARFTWDEANNTFLIESPHGHKMELTKAYSFALMRFIIRISQKNFLKNPLAKRIISKDVEENIPLEESEDDPRQLKLPYIND
jgi:hypothetical protein